MRKIALLSCLTCIVVAIVSASAHESALRTTHSLSDADTRLLASMTGGTNDKWCGGAPKSCTARSQAAWGDPCTGIYAVCDTCLNTGPLCLFGSCTNDATLKDCTPHPNDTCTVTSYDCGTATKGNCSGIMIEQVPNEVCPTGWWLTCQAIQCNPQAGNPQRNCVSGWFCSVT